MLTDKKLTMCQDVTPNTSEAKEMMYAITWNEAGDKMIQVGIAPKRLLNEVKQNEISAVVADMPVYKDMEILVVDADTKVVAGATDSSKTGLELDSIDTSHYRCVAKAEWGIYCCCNGKGFLLPSGNLFCHSYRWGIPDSGFVLHGIYAVEGHEREV